MADTREKLIELVGQVQDCGCDVTDVVEMNYVENNVLVDHLIANGVTIQKWIPVTERLPEKYTPVLGIAKRNPFAKWMPMVVEWVGNGWACLVNDQYIECCGWMPLPQPPKGE